MIENTRSFDIQDIPPFFFLVFIPPKKSNIRFKEANYLENSTTIDFNFSTTLIVEYEYDFFFAFPAEFLIYILPTQKFCLNMDCYTEKKISFFMLSRIIHECRFLFGLRNMAIETFLEFRFSVLK